MEIFPKNYPGEGRPTRFASGGASWRNAGVAIFLAVAIHTFVIAFVVYADAMVSRPQSTEPEAVQVEIVNEPQLKQPDPEPQPKQAEIQPVQDLKIVEPDSEEARIAEPHVAKPEPLQSPPVSPRRTPQERTPQERAPQERAPEASQPQPRSESPTDAMPQPEPPSQSAGGADSVSLPQPVSPSPTAAMAPPEPATRALLRPTSGATADYPLAPPSFQAIAIREAASQAENEDYKTLVFGLLEAAKHYPEKAEARRAAGAAIVHFQLDAAGNLVLASLLRSTGDAELDAEALALVRRLSPYPRPPAGAVLNFTPMLRFVLGAEPK